MKANWIISDEYLALKCMNGSILVPSGVEVFKAEYRQQKEILNQKISKPSNSFPNIKFSKYPLKLFIDIISSKDKKRSTFQLEIKGRQNEFETIINKPLTRIADQIISTDAWYAFEKGSLEELVSILKRYNISESGELTLHQMLDLIKDQTRTIAVNINVDLNDLPSYIDFEDLPKSFAGVLYPYQNIGYNWLRMINREGLGCILADEMGLGKTVQIICLILKNIEEHRGPSLVIAPATLLENWRREFLKFSPKTKSYVHKGQERTGFPSDLEEFHVVITSYSTLMRDSSVFRMIKWDMVVADEAQAIKNPDAERTKILKSLYGRVCIAVSGTPVQNRLTDLWSIMDFVFPNLLGTRRNFESRFKNNIPSASFLEPLITPLILRRTINSVALDLPERIDIPQAIEMPLNMALEYEDIRQNILEQWGKRAQLVSMQKLRMFCTHPTLITRLDKDPVKINPKYCRLIEILEEIFDNDEQVLIFTSFRKMIDILLEDLPKRFPDIWINWIDGRVLVNERQSKVDEFNTCKKSAVLILNPRAAGTGLNLTGANHVIHYNLEWNPAVEDQASARAHRIGQTKPVTIHRLFFADTVEEVIDDRVDFKRRLAETSIQGINGELEGLPDLMMALQITPIDKS